MADIFLSYSREDQAVARQVIHGLEQEGFSVWWDQALNAGETFDKATEKALEAASSVVVLWSKRSVDSDWVRAEASQARASQRLVPAMIEPCKRPILFEMTQTADLIGWQGDTGEPRWRAFVASIARLTGSQAAAAAGASTSGTLAARATPDTSSRRGWIAAAALALALVAGAALWYWQRGVTPAPATSRQQSIAVLPFDDMSPGKDQGYFADGVAEEILNQLSRIGTDHLRVIARNSSFALRGKPAQEIGQMLGVGHVLEGSLRRDGDQLRITAQLVDAKSNTSLWSKSFNRPLTGVFAVQEEIAGAVAEALQISLGVGIGQLPGMTHDVEAYDAFLQAKYEMGLFTADSWRRAEGFARQASQKDPAFTQPRSQLFQIYMRMNTFVSGNEDEWRGKAAAELEELHRLQPDSSDYQIALAMSNFTRGNTREALRHFDSVRSGPMGPEAVARIQEVYPVVLLSLGRVREAIALLKEARVRDPLNGQFAFWLANSLDMSGDSGAALAEAKHGYEMGGAFQALFISASLMPALGSHDHEQLVHWLRLSASTPNGDPNQNNAQRLAQLDTPDEALASLRSTAASPATSPVQLAGLAPWLAYYGDAEGALRALQAARRVSRLESYFWSSVYRDVRRLPAFKQQLKDEGWPEIWRETGNWGDFCKPLGADDFECQ